MLETASELADLGVGPRLTAELQALAADRDAPVAAPSRRTLVDDPTTALDLLAAVLLMLGSDYPRPTNGIFVAITVMNCTFASSGRVAM